MKKKKDKKWGMVRREIKREEKKKKRKKRPILSTPRSPRFIFIALGKAQFTTLKVTVLAFPLALYSLQRMAMVAPKVVVLETRVLWQFAFWAGPQTREQLLWQH